MEKRARNYLLLIGLSIFIVLMVWILSPIIIGQPKNNTVYTVNDKNSDKSSFAKKISQLDIDTATWDDLVKLFGEPEKYMWGENTYTKENLPDYYTMKYSDKFEVLIVEGKILELRFYNPAYSFMDSISVGSRFDDVKKALGQPIPEEKAIPNQQMKEGILYTYNSEMADFTTGVLNYTIKGKSISLVFRCYSVLEMDLKRKDRDFILSNYKSKDSLGNTPTRLIDKTDYPFVSDPEVAGEWKSIDFVKEINDFKPNHKKLEENNNRLKIIFAETGKTDRPAWTWTKGMLLDNSQITASKYEIKEIDGTQYMFLQWKNGDYVFQGTKPCYYVLKKVE